jgi:hypothetical protein
MCLLGRQPLAQRIQAQSSGLSHLVNSKGFADHGGPPSEIVSRLGFDVYDVSAFSVANLVDCCLQGTAITANAPTGRGTGKGVVGGLRAVRRSSYRRGLSGCRRQCRPAADRVQADPRSVTRSLILNEPPEGGGREGQHKCRPFVSDMCRRVRAFCFHQWRLRTWCDAPLNI